MPYELLLLLLMCIIGTLSQQVNTTVGPIIGSVEKTNSGKTYYAYHTIPYGKPPTGLRRFLSSEPIDPWTKVYNATTQKSNICFQLYSDAQTETEDCLYLSVFTTQHPVSTTNKKMAVFVNIHGGGFYTGSGLVSNEFSPEYLLDEDVVVVSFNYRLGVFGFLSTGDNVIPGNAGLSDQILALKWVRDNIAAFGGDSGKVTIAGQSAGAKSVGYLILSPAAKGLFSGAIMESGTPLCVGGYQPNHTEIAFKVGSFIDPQFKVSFNSAKLLVVLQNASAKEVNGAAKSFKNWAGEQSNFYERNPYTQGYYFTPSIDSASSNPILPELLYEAVANGRINKVPIFAGICSEEGLMDGSYQDNAHLKAYDEIPSLLNPQDMNILGADAWREVGNLIKQEYALSGSFFSNPLGAIQYQTDQEYARGSTKYAELQSAFTDVFYYQFSYTGVMGGATHGYPGSGNVSHVGEMNYIYGGKPLKNYSEYDQLISRRLVKLWTNFAKYKNPTPKLDELLQNISWPTVKIDNFQYVNIGNFKDTNMVVTKGKPRGNRMPFWDKLYEKYGNKPFNTY